MALKKSELYSSLWSSCDELRGGMDASQYKDYVLVLLFVKYVSDKFAGQPFAPITIPEGAGFKDMVALKGTLLLCSRATIGEIRIAGCEICTNQGFKSLVCMPGVSNEFLYYKVLTMKSQMIERAIGSTFLEISKKDTAALELSIPDLPEQTAIAEVLSDMDVELAALEQRRDKTRALKQGMMQELLTGRTRLV